MVKILYWELNHLGSTPGSDTDLWQVLKVQICKGILQLLR